MSRLILTTKYRLITITLISAVALVALVWPAASLWKSFAQSSKAAQSLLAAQADSSQSRQPTDILARLIAASTPAAANAAARNGSNQPGLISPIAQTNNLLVPTISATKTAMLFTDVDTDGRADPGDTLKYTVTITNSGTDASNVIFTDTLESNLTLAAGSVNTSPLAVNDTYSVTGNIQITKNAASGLLTNDFDPDTGNNTGLTASGPATTTMGGNLTVNADGGFVYNPAPGFEGADTFTYTVTDGSGATGTGTVTLNVSGMIWFINASAGGGGDGRLSSPFNCLVGAGCYNGSANDPSDNIFLYSGAYTGGLTLKNNQRVIGQGAGASISTITGLTPPSGSLALPSTGGTNPTVTTVAAATSAFTLASGNTMRGLTIGNTTAADITGTGFGTLTVAEVTLNGTGRALDLNNGTLAATFQSITSTSSSTQGIVLQSVAGTLTSSGGTTISGAATQGILISGSTVTADFGNTSVAAGTDGVSLQNNSSGTRTFGTLSITNGSGVGFLHAGGGGLTNITGTTTITNPGGRGIDIQNATASNGVTFANTTSTQSGGTGVNLQSNAGTITFGTLDITPDSGQRGLFSSGSSGTITTTGGTVNTPSAVAVEINGTSAASRTPLAIVFVSVSSSSAANGIVLSNTSGTFAINGTGTTAGSGGTIQNITNRGASFISANGITLKNMNFTNVGTVNGDDPTNSFSTCGGLENGLGGNLGCNAGIHMVSVIGATFDRLVMNGGVQQGINGNNVTTFTLSNSSVQNFGNETGENGIQFRDLLGTNTMSSDTVTGNRNSQLNVTGTSGTLTLLTVTGGSYGTSSPPNGTDGITVKGTGSANMTVSVQSAALSNNASDGFFYSATDTSFVNATVNSCTVQTNGNSGVNVNVVNNASGKFTITNNTINGIQGNAINVNLAAPSTGTFQGTVSGNIIGTTTAGTGAAFGDGIRILGNGSGQLIAAVTNNQVRGITFGEGISASAINGSNALNVTITGNTIDLNSPVNSLRGIFSQSGATATDTNSVCADIGGAGALANTIANTAGADGIRVRNRFPTTTFRLPGYAGGGSDTAAVVAYLNARNNNSDTTSATISGNTFGGGGACTQPSFVDAVASVPAVQPADNTQLSANASIASQTVAVFNASLLTETWQPAFFMNDVAASDSHAGDRAQASGTDGVFSNHAQATNNTARVSAGNDSTPERHDNAQDESLKGKRPDVQGQQPTIKVTPAKRDKSGRPEAGETITVGAPTGFTLPAGKTITIMFRATIGNPMPAITQVSNQGSVAGSNFATVLTDDPAVGGTADPTVTQVDSTTITVASNANPSVFGQSVTFTATLTGVPSRANTMGGTVQFKENGNNIGSPVAVVGAANSGTAQVSTSSLSVGNHTITAVYSGDSNFNANTGSMTGNPQVVNKANTTTGLTSNANPSVFGQSVTFTATVAPVAPGSGAPSGTVQFLDGVNPITGCTAVTLAAGQAQCATSALAAGNHTITTTYSGDGNFNTSNGSLTGNPQVVNKADTSVGLTSSQNPAPQGTSITFTATIAVTAPGAGTPSGTVQFLDGATPITGCTAVTVAANQAQCVTSALTVGNHTITAQYSGDGNFNTSTGNLTGNPQVITGPPVINPTIGLTRVQGVAASNSQIATVSDDVSTPGAITVTAMTIPPGINITNIVNTAGNITADISAECTATLGTNTVVIKATDGKALNQTANLDINVTANPVPTLGNYENIIVATGCKAILTPTAPPADNVSVSSVMVTTAPAGYTGSISVDPVTGIVTATNAGPANTYTVSVKVTDSCGAMTTKNFTLQVNPTPTNPNQYDFDGDKKADIAVYRTGATASDPSYWYILRSSDGMFQFQQFGADSDVIVPGDYNGDGSTDFAVFRPSINTWFTSLNAATNYGAFQWGVSGDIPVPGKYFSSDAKTDIAVFRPSDGNWYIVNSFDNSTSVIHWGQMGDKPVVGDYDGDGISDLAVWRTSDATWYIRLSSGGTQLVSWGNSTDVLVPADYDGDGKTDPAVYRPSTSMWYILQSSTGTSRSQIWGLANDMPVPADYDNDGKADLAVYRPSMGAWYIFRSCLCTQQSATFGLSSDKPVESAFTPPVGP